MQAVGPRAEVTAEDMDSLTRHREALLQGGMKLRPLLKSVLLSDEYRAAADDTRGGVPLKLVTPNLLLSQVRELTGFQWETADGSVRVTDFMPQRDQAPDLVRLHFAGSQ